MDRLAGSQSVLFITGAGISADSGLPTYRGVGGLYNVDNTEEGLPIEQIMSGSMLQANPELTWKYLAKIAAAAAEVELPALVIESVPEPGQELLTKKTFFRYKIN